MEFQPKSKLRQIVLLHSSLIIFDAFLSTGVSCRDILRCMEVGRLTSKLLLLSTNPSHQGCMLFSKFLFLYKLG